LLPGETYTIAVDFNECTTTTGNSRGEVWIDFDRNATFAPDEALGFVFGVPSATANSAFTFTVPVDAVPGTTRMRVAQHSAGGAYGFGPLNPCAGSSLFNWGSVMDFTINI